MAELGSCPPTGGRSASDSPSRRERGADAATQMPRMDRVSRQETTNLAKWNVLVQAGTSMLTQANQSAQIALRLITGLG